METKRLSERNNAIDFLRGCVSISIMLIHTVWWSGESYLPKWFSNLFLWFDVPIFIFISGLAYNYVESVGKNIKNILKQWNKWIFFLIFYILIIFIFFRSEFKYTQLINYIFYKVPSSGSLCVVGGSLWYVTMYIKVTIFCSIILYFYNQNQTIKSKHILLFMIFLSMVNISFIDSYIAIYSFVYLLGYFSYKNKINSGYSFIFMEAYAVIFVNVLFSISGYGIVDIQSLKFPPTIFYLSFSVPGIILVWFLKDRIRISKSNPINYIGKNAIFFYYSQGISSSILYFIKPLIMVENIYLKFLIMAVINIVMAIIIGAIINELFNVFTKIIDKVKKMFIQNYGELFKKSNLDN